MCDALTAPQIAWHAAGRPRPEGKTGAQYRFEPAPGDCITCAAPIAEGVPFAGRRGVRGIDNDTFSGHAEYARWGTHACAACAWLYGDPKRTHRGMLALGTELWWPTIASPMDGRPRWRTLLGRLARAAPGTPMTGVLTTDPKPRLWPRMQAASADAPGLYVHAPDYDWSRWTPFILREVAVALGVVDEARQLGASKTAIWSGLGAGTQLADRHGAARICAVEARLAPLRGGAALTVALMVT